MLSGQRLPLSGMIRNTLAMVAEREQQRRRLINILVLAQGLLTLAIAVGYVGAGANVPVLAIYGVALVIYMAAFITSRTLRNTSLASYLLVFGGGLAWAAQVIVAATSGHPSEAAQSSLFFLAVVLESGLLFSPEITLLTAATTTTITAAAMLFSLAVTSTTSQRDAYLLVVFTVSLQALTGLIAWLVAQFIFESAFEAQRAQELQFAQARLDALLLQTEEQRLRLEEDIAVLQGTITRVLGGQYTARAELLTGDLSVLAGSFNLLLDRIESATQSDQMRARMEAAALPLIEAMGRMTEPNTPTPSSLPMITNTPLDSISVALTHMHQTMTRRLSRIQSLASEVSAAIDHSRDGLATTNDEVLKAQQIAGALIAMSESFAVGLQRQMELLSRARRLLGTLLPAAITQMSDTADDASGREPGAAAALRGLGHDLGVGTPGLTAEFEAIQVDADGGAGIAPLTIPLPALTPEAVAAARAAGTSTAEVAARAAEMAPTEPLALPEGEVRAELTEVWGLLAQIIEEAAAEERGTATLAHELGVLSRSVRQADVGIAWVVQALEAIKRDTEQLQQTVGSSVPPPEMLEPSRASTSRPITQPGVAPRTPQLTRPLSDTRLDDGTLAELAGEMGSGTPAPGSLRAADLLNSDALQPPTDAGNTPQS